MTDAEIIKALECCGKNILCIHCPLHEMQQKEGLACCDNLKLLALDLINRQKAEIERLNKNLETETNHITRLENQIERLLPRLETIKAEAYKEVEENIDKITWYHINKNGELVMGANSETDTPLYKAKDIHNLLKELVGDSNEN